LSGSNGQGEDVTGMVVVAVAEAFFFAFVFG
jgi:hypothetical protein